MHARILLVVLALVLFTPLCLPARPRLDPGPPQRPLDDEALLTRHLQSLGGLRPVPLASARDRSVEIGEGRAIALGTLTDLAFAEQRDHETSLRGLPVGRATLGPPVVSEDVYVLPGAYAVVRSTRITVIDPRTVSDASATFRDFLDSRSSPRIDVAALSPESRAGLDRFMKEEVPSLAPDDPLAEAARQGRPALLQAIVEGRGTFEVADTLIVPTTFPRVRNGRLEIPSFTDGRLDYGRPVALQSLDPLMIVSDPRVVLSFPATPIEMPPAQVPVYRESGSHEYGTAFMAGFTRGGSWEWERRWRYPSGFFRATFGAGYGIGLRVPIEVKGRLSPDTIVVRDRTDQASSFRNRVEARAFDAPASFYRAAGVPAAQLFDGKEAVLEARVGFGFKFRVFWTDVLHRRYAEHAVRFSQDGTPPFADGGTLRIELPASLTGTELDFGAVKGYAQAGLALKGDGEVRLQHEALVDGHPGATRTLVFRDRVAQEVATSLPLSASDATHEYGFRLTRPVYRAALDLVPQVRLGIRVGCDGFSRSFRTGWISLNAARIDLGDVELGRHAGTRAAFSYEGGRKRFERLQGRVAAATVPTGTVLMQSAHNGRYVTIAAHPDALLQAVEGSAARATRFTLVPQADGRVALRAASGQYVRGGLGTDCLLGASSRHVREWETFEYVAMTGGRGALRSPRSGGHVRAGVGRESFLSAAGGRRIGSWETFRFIEAP